MVNTAYYVNGMVKHLVHDPARSWSERIGDYAEALRLVAHHLDVGFVQCGTGAGSSWDSLETGPPTLPGTREYHIRGNRHLLLAQVPAARGMQVLTERHLERATDLSGWTIEDLGSGRHLVVAADLEAWYGHGAPDPEVLAEARTAFGPMIVRKEDIRPPLGLKARGRDGDPVTSVEGWSNSLAGALGGGVIHWLAAATNQPREQR